MIRRRIIILLLFFIWFYSVDAQSELEVYNRNGYIEIRFDLNRLPDLIKRYSDSKSPIHLDLTITEEDILKEEHFSELAKLPLSFFRFNVWNKEKFYCSGLDKLQSLDSLELGGFSSHPFLEDASKLRQLEFLQLELFIQDSTIKQKSSFTNLKKLRISLSRVYDISMMFDSLPKLRDLDVSKCDARFNLGRAALALKESPLENLCLGLATIDTSDFNNAVFPTLKNVWLVGVSNGIKHFNFEQFISQNSSLEFVDLRMNNLSDEFMSDIRRKFPKIKIERDW